MTDKVPKFDPKWTLHDFMKVFSFCEVIQPGSKSFIKAVFGVNVLSYLAAFVEELK